MDRVYSTDVAAALETVISVVRDGLRKVRDDNVALVQIPEKIDFDFTMIIRKDDLVRTETTMRDPTTTTINTGASTDTDTRITSAGRITDETETMTWVRSGGETGGETGGESGGSSGGQSVTHSDSGGEIESYTYENI